MNLTFTINMNLKICFNQLSLTISYKFRWQLKKMEQFCSAIIHMIHFQKISDILSIVHRKKHNDPFIH